MILDWTVEELVLTEPLRTSQATMTSRDAVCVRLSHQGVDGLGEVVTSIRQRDQGQAGGGGQRRGHRPGTRRAR